MSNVTALMITTRVYLDPTRKQANPFTSRPDMDSIVVVTYSGLLSKLRKTRHFWVVGLINKGIRVKEENVSLSLINDCPI